MQKTLKCTDCHGDMELGFIPDATYGMVFQTAWHEGDAKEKKGFLEKLSTGGGVRFDAQHMIPITAYRCAQCGLIKLYARHK